jgi:hypothetical protein
MHVRQVLTEMRAARSDGPLDSGVVHVVVGERSVCARRIRDDS